MQQDGEDSAFGHEPQPHEYHREISSGKGRRMPRRPCIRFLFVESDVCSAFLPSPSRGDAVAFGYQFASSGLERTCIS
jgi:hypothetical protein